MKIAAAVAVVAICFMPSAIAAQFGLQRWIEVTGGKPWAPPADGVVTNGRTAIAIAHAIVADELPTAADEKTWQERMKTNLEDGIWEVYDEPPAGSIGGSCSYFVSRSDGRFLGAYCAQ